MAAAMGVGERASSRTDGRLHRHVAHNQHRKSNGGDPVHAWSTAARVHRIPSVIRIADQSMLQRTSLRSVLDRYSARSAEKVHSEPYLLAGDAAGGSRGHHVLEGAAAAVGAWLDGGAAIDAGAGLMLGGAGCLAGLRGGMAGWKDLRRRQSNPCTNGQGAGRPRGGRHLRRDAGPRSACAQLHGDACYDPGASRNCCRQSFFNQPRGITLDSRIMAGLIQVVLERE